MYCCVNIPKKIKSSLHLHLLVLSFRGYHFWGFHRYDLDKCVDHCVCSWSVCELGLSTRFVVAVRRRPKISNLVVARGIAGRRRGRWWALELPTSRKLALDTSERAGLGLHTRLGAANVFSPHTHVVGVTNLGNVSCLLCRVRQHHSPQ